MLSDVSGDLFDPIELRIDKVNSPSHYNSGDIEAIDAIEAQLSKEEYEGFLRGNCVKYLWRWKHKGGTEDLEKTQWYLNKLIESSKIKLLKL